MAPFHDDERPHVGLKVIRLNRLRKGNALGRALLRALAQDMAQAGTCPVALCGLGSNFCTGLDLDEIRDAGSATEHLRLYVDLLKHLDAHPASTMSLINGRAVGGGTGLALCTDVAIAVSTAHFALPGDDRFAPLVDIPKAAVRARRGAQAYSTWERHDFKLSAHEALTCGLIDRVVDAAEWERCIADPLSFVISSNALGRRRTRRLQAQGIWTDVEKLLTNATTDRATAALMQALQARNPSSAHRNRSACPGSQSLSDC